MSWSVSSIGKPGPVAVEIERQFAQAGPCVQPEEGIRQAARSALALALAAQDPDSAVKVSASGHQSPTYKGGVMSGQFINTFKLDVEPIAGFVG